MKLHGSRWQILQIVGIASYACALALSVCAAASATTLLRMSLGQMAQRAPLIVRARCISNRTAWDAGEIWTFTTFEVLDIWRNSSPEPLPTRIVVRLLGGTVGNLTSHISDVPRFAPSEELILFLEPTPRGDYSVLSWQQGTFRIRHDAQTGSDTITQDTASVATFDTFTRRFVIRGIRNRSLPEFRAEVDAALRASEKANP